MKTGATLSQPHEAGHLEPVFVYGTLKRGFPLHEKGLLGVRFLGDFETVSPYPLFIAKDFYGPIMLDRPGEGLVVIGEVYEVDARRLNILDELEDVGKPGSFRSKLSVRPIGGGVAINAPGFMKDETWLEPLHSGYLSDYQDRRFVPPENR